MLKEDLKDNLVKAISELKITNFNNIKFVVVPIVEVGKKLNTTDDYMRLGILNKENLGNSYFTLDEVIGMFSGPDSRFPLWVTVEVLEERGNECIIELKTSLRFRTPSILQNQDTGHPPFKVIKN